MGWRIVSPAGVVLRKGYPTKDAAQLARQLLAAHIAIYGRATVEED